MRIEQVVGQIGWESSGPAYSVRRLAETLALQDNDVCLHVLRLGEAPDLSRVQLHQHALWPPWIRLGIAPSMHRALRAHAPNAHVIHSHGLWLALNLYPTLAARGTNCKVIVSPRGTLSPVALKRSALGKSIWWHLWQHNVIERADCLHATAQSEVEDFRARGLRGPIALIPNGIDVPDGTPTRERGSDPRRVLFLGRLHPIKGIDILLRAWAQLGSLRNGWQLRIAGPDNDGHEHQLRSQMRALGLRDVCFIGPVFGQTKADEYARADLYVLPSRSENFGISVAEALAAGVPALVSKKAPWRDLEVRRCGWWLDLDADAFAGGLRHAMALSDSDRSEIGRRGRSWMKEEFSWDCISSQMSAVYAWLIGAGPRPPCIVPAS